MKKFLSFVLALCLCLTLLPSVALAEPDRVNIDQTTVYSNGMLILRDDIMKLTENVTARYIDSMDGSSRGIMTLDLNGHVLQVTGADNAINMNGPQKLILTDSSPAAEHYFVVNEATGKWTYHGDTPPAAGDYKLIKGGVIFCQNGRGVSMTEKSALVMNSGSIFGCATSGDGGGVYVNVTGGSGVNREIGFIMNGGSIIGCTAANGSGVYVASGSMYANGGTIDGDVVNNGTITRSTSAEGFTTFNGTVSGNGTIDPAASAYTVTFNLNGGAGAAPAEQKLLKGQKASAPTAAREGYTLEGWYTEATGGTKYDFNTAVTKTMTLYAYWKMNQYTITYELNGGTDPGNPSGYDITSDEITLQAPTKDGYRFLGWTWDGQETPLETVTIPTGSTGLRVYTAHWEKIDDFAWLLPVLGALDKQPFDDVTTGDWFYDDVHYVNEYGLMTGTGSRTFSPDAPVTRGMVMTILARREGIMTDRYSPWYAAGVEWAVVNGISDGSNPEAEITREELATMLYRYAKLKGYDLSGAALTGYADAGSVSGYAVSAMQWAVGSGLVNGAAGVNAGKLLPQSTATRAQLAAILHRFFG